MNEITGRRPQRKRESPQAAPGCRSPRIREGRPGRERRRRARAAARGGRLPPAGRARRRGRGGPRWAGAGRAAGAAEEAGAGLRLPGRPHCSALAPPFARLALPEGGVLWPKATPPHSRLPELRRSGRAGSARQVLSSDSASKGFPTPEHGARRLYNVPLNWRKLGKPATHTLRGKAA